MFPPFRSLPTQAVEVAVSPFSRTAMGASVFRNGLGKNPVRGEGRSVERVATKNLRQPQPCQAAPKLLAERPLPSHLASEMLLGFLVLAFATEAKTFCRSTLLQVNQSLADSRDVPLGEFSNILTPDQVQLCQIGCADACHQNIRMVWIGGF